MDKLTLFQIEFHGHCGVTEAERITGQRLSVDIEIEYDVKKAAESDRIEDTVDYNRLSKEIVRLGRETKVHLIETLAERIAGKVLEDLGISSARVCLKKCLPPVEEIRGGVMIEIYRTRMKGPV
ncbi:MAG: dihydroneopterin aldolase [Candidatus Manganitrophaceae bacterium]